MITSGFLPVGSSIQFYKEVWVENLLDSSQLGTSTQFIPSYPIPKVKIVNIWSAEWLDFQEGDTKLWNCWTLASMVHDLVSLGNIYGLGKGLFSFGCVELLVNQFSP